MTDFLVHVGMTATVCVLAYQIWRAGGVLWQRVAVVTVTGIAVTGLLVALTTRA